ncbi:MAG: methionyl-tRNA formyltransferase [Candidatus Zixiibacteriota bacterium]
MKIVFMGTPEFARRPLEYLHSNTRHQIIAVVTGPDKQAGRGRKTTPTTVKQTAKRLDLPVFTPVSLTDDGFISQMKQIPADLYIVVAFRILPEKLFSIPKFGSINLHGSLLPKYRGAAPINWAIINGEHETGLTSFFLKKKVDTGNIIYQEKIQIGENETFDELYTRMSESAGPVIEKTLDMIESENYKLKVQDNNLATPAPKINPEDCQIDWTRNSNEVRNFIRGLSTVPGAFTYFKGKKLKIFSAEIAECGSGHNIPGKIIGDKKRLMVKTANGVVEIKELLPEGKKKMSGEQFLRGYHPENEILGERI